MKHILKLLKAWKDPNGKDWAIGDQITVDSKSLAGELVMDGIAEIVNPSISGSVDTKAIGAAVTAAVTAAVAGLPEQTAKAVHAVTVKDLSDEDPTHGYLPEVNRPRTKSEKLFGLGQFCKDVYEGGQPNVKVPERLMKSMERSRKAIQKAAGTGLTITEDESVGSLIPPEFNTMLLDVAAETATIRPRCSILTIGSNSIELPRVSDYDRSGGLVYGGLLAYWKGEDALLTSSRPVTENVQLTLKALTILAYASHQAMRFSPVDIGAYLLPKMASAITFKEEEAFVAGSGAGMPLGILNSGAKISLTKETGQTTTANVIVTANIDKMIARIKVGNAASVCFCYNRPELYGYLIALARTVGVGGQLALLYQAQGNVLAGDATLNGIPCMDTEHMPAAGTAGDLTLVDWSNYIIADDRRGPEVAQSMHLKFDYGQEAFRIMKYVDGQLADKKVTTRLKGSNTTAPVVVRESL